ncbi:TetR/AcrR family transcriptional regulator [Nocardioides sp. LHD-245]|uniref:TetR/AcrR family transcriptional regulator n=1 Tax=Nocardioides sp. LHD-245 TaxID=3051387 RepID=UPI0027E08F61|nr:TetR/AcrR family transcriptional regulator [Nocardioides sp. LHD-245]
MTSSSEVREVGTRNLTAQQIMDTTVEFFAANGYLGTKLDDVAERLGVTRQALYYYYKRKHDILFAICDDLLTSLHAAVQDASDVADGPAERLKLMLQAYTSVVAARPTYSAVVTRDFTFLPPKEERLIRHQRRAMTDLFLEAMEDAVAQGVAKKVPPEISVSLMLGAANWVYRWFRPSVAMSADDLAVVAADILLEGVLVG